MRTLCIIALLVLAGCTEGPERTDITVEVIADTQTRNDVCGSRWPNSVACYVDGKIYVRSSNILKPDSKLTIPADLFIPTPGDDFGINAECGYAIAEANDIDLWPEPNLAADLCHEVGHAVEYANKNS